jgi:hypothetical protein
VKCRTELLALASLLRKSIQRIECRHAALRRRVHKRIQTHHAPFEDTSTSFVLMRQRLMERCHLKGMSAAAKTAEREVKQREGASGKLKAARSGGGGLRRAALSSLLSSLNAGGCKSTEERSEAFSEAHRQVASASEEQLKHWAEIGEAATAAHAGGFRSFGPRCRKRKGTPEDDGPLKRMKQIRADVSRQDPSSASRVREHALAIALREEDQKSWEDKVAEIIAADVEHQRHRQTEDQNLGHWIHRESHTAQSQRLPLQDQFFDVQWLDWCPPGRQIALESLSGPLCDLSPTHPST